MANKFILNWVLFIIVTKSVSNHLVQRNKHPDIFEFELRKTG